MEERLRLTAAQRAEMVDHARRGLPNEACGLLGGPPGAVARVYCVENSYHSPVAYHMDPAAQVAAMVDIEQAGWEIVGIFHSHPSGPAAPSPTDVELAFYPDAVYIILAPNGPGRWGMRGFRIEQGRVREVTLVMVE